MTRRWAAAWGAVVLALTLGTAHASTLSLTAPQPPAHVAAEKCAQADVRVSGTAGEPSLTVSGIPAACGGLPLRVWLHDSRTTDVTTRAPEGGGEVTVRPAGIELSPQTSALTTIDTWPMPTTARIAPAPRLPFVSCRTPDDPSIGCTARVVDANDWGEGDHRRWNRMVRVSTTASSPVRWELVFNFSAEEIRVQPTPQVVDYQGAFTIVGSSGCGADQRTVTVRGRSSQGNTMVGGQWPYWDFQVEGRATVDAPGPFDVLYCP